MRVEWRLQSQGAVTMDTDSDDEEQLLISQNLLKLKNQAFTSSQSVFSQSQRGMLVVNVSQSQRDMLYVIQIQFDLSLFLCLDFWCVCVWEEGC